MQCFSQKAYLFEDHVTTSPKPRPSPNPRPPLPPNPNPRSLTRSPPQNKQQPQPTSAVVTWYLKPWCLPGETMTDMYYPIYAEGLYNSLMQAAAYGVPLYITETGIADKSDANRARMIDQYFQAVRR